MTTGTLTLAEFLLARITEDEERFHVSEADDAMARTTADLNEGYIVGLHERLLAECEAKRRIVKLHGRRGETAHFERWDHQRKQMDRWRGTACRQCGHIDEWPIEWPCGTLRLLALPYADHPDYRDEWRP